MKNRLDPLYEFASTLFSVVPSYGEPRWGPTLLLIIEGILSVSSVEEQLKYPWIEPEKLNVTAEVFNSSVDALRRFVNGLNAYDREAQEREEDMRAIVISLIDSMEVEEAPASWIAWVVALISFSVYGKSDAPMPWARLMKDLRKVKASHLLEFGWRSEWGKKNLLASGDKLDKKFTDSVGRLFAYSKDRSSGQKHELKIRIHLTQYEPPELGGKCDKVVEAINEYKDKGCAFEIADKALRGQFLTAMAFAADLGQIAARWSMRSDSACRWWPTARCHQSEGVYWSHTERGRNTAALCEGWSRTPAPSSKLPRHSMPKDVGDPILSEDGLIERIGQAIAQATSPSANDECRLGNPRPASLVKDVWFQVDRNSAGQSGSGSRHLYIRGVLSVRRSSAQEKRAPPLIVIIPNLYGGADDHIVRDTRDVAWSFGASTLCLDLRGQNETLRFDILHNTESGVAVPTYGELEARDIESILKTLNNFMWSTERPVFSEVMLVGYGFGGRAALRAALRCQGKRHQVAGVLAISPPISAAATLDRMRDFGLVPPKRLRRLFLDTESVRLRPGLGWKTPWGDDLSFLGCEVPLILVFAEDDPFISNSEFQAMMDGLDRNERDVERKIIRVPFGGHTGFVYANQLGSRQVFLSFVAEAGAASSAKSRRPH
jgi:pimeloyl-ACP methyl ester carboxylesterase